METVASQILRVWVSSWTNEVEGQQDRGVAVEREAGTLHGDGGGRKGALRSWCVGGEAVSLDASEETESEN